MHRKNHRDPDLPQFNDNDDVDLIVCDYYLPGGNGIDLIKQFIKSSKDAQRTIPPILIISSDMSILDKINEIPEINGFLYKPLSPAVILELVDTHLQKKTFTNKDEENSKAI